MSDSPMISIAVPCYNVAPLLPWALSSLLAQTYTDWECIVVDDGSTDHPGKVVDAIADPRIRFIRLETNRGRAAARQVALDAAQGGYLAKLDADDWLYPDKLRLQHDTLERMPDVALVSAGIAIEDERGRLVGVRARGDLKCASRPPLARPVSPPVAHAACMIRMDVAKRYRYDRRLRRSEDADYLLSLLSNHAHCVMHDVLYAYCEFRSTSKNDTLDAYHSRIQMFWSHRDQDRLAAVQGMATSALKWALYRTAYAMGRADILISQRSAAPSQEDARQFRQARGRVAAVYRKLFGATAQAKAQEAEVIV